jgi:D-amino-acid dehydrogenase
VTVLEVEPGSSLHNAGLITPSHFVPLAAPGMVRLGLKWMFNPDSPFYIRPRLDAELLSWLWRFNAASTARRAEKAMPLLRDLSFASLALFEQMAALPGMAFEFAHRGLLMVFRTEHGRHGALATARHAVSIGIEARVLDAQGLAVLEPGVDFRVLGGVYYPDDAHLTPALFLASLRANLIAANVRFLTSTRVLGLETRPGSITALRTSQGAVQADEYVLAAGCWSPGIVRDIGLRLPVQPGKGYSITLQDPGIRVRIPMILEEARIAVTPMGDSLRLAGTMELSGMDPGINMRRVRAILKAAPDYLGNLHAADPGALAHWAGLRPCTPDGLPLIGRFRRFDNLIAATGHAMVGVSLAPVTGKLVAEIVGGKVPSIDMHLLRPDRYA